MLLFTCLQFGSGPWGCVVVVIIRFPRAMLMRVKMMRFPIRTFALPTMELHAVCREVRNWVDVRPSGIIPLIYDTYCVVRIVGMPRRSKS